jgi:hypothetical protein
MICRNASAVVSFHSKGLPPLPRCLFAFTVARPSASQNGTLLEPPARDMTDRRRNSRPLALTWHMAIVVGGSCVVGRRSGVACALLAVRPILALGDGEGEQVVGQVPRTAWGLIRSGPFLLDTVHVLTLCDGLGVWCLRRGVGAAWAMHR